MPLPYLPLLMKNYTPVLHPMPALTITEYDQCPAVCVRFSKELVPYLLGLLEIYRWEDKFSGTPEEVANSLGVIQDFVAALMEACVCCCDDGKPKIPEQYRYTPTGRLEVSYDGGETWEDGSAFDQRNQVVVVPPPAVPPDDAKCNYAENISDKVKESVDKLVVQINGGASVVAAAPALLAVWIALGGPANPLASLMVIVYGIISAVIGLINADLTGTFDSTWWSDFKCYWYCVIAEDGTVTDANIQAVKNKVIERLSSPTNPLAIQVITSMIDGMGAKMLTNAARMGDSILSSDCSGCDCGCADGCSTTETFYEWDDAAWTTHGAYTRFSAGTPEGDHDSFTLAGTDAILDLGATECITYVVLRANHGVGAGGGRPFAQLYIDDVPQGEMEMIDNAGGDPPSCFWDLAEGVAGQHIKIAQTTPPTSPGYGALLISLRVLTCE